MSGPLSWHQQQRLNIPGTALPAAPKYNPIVMPKLQKPNSVMYNPLQGYPGYQQGASPLAGPLQMPHNNARRNQMLGMMPPMQRQSTSQIMTAKPPRTIPKLQGPKQQPFPAPAPPNIQPRLRPRLY